MLLMPAPDQEAINDRERIAADLAALLPPASVIAAPAALKAYETDALTAYRQLPLVAVLPASTDEVVRVLRYCHWRKLKVVPRGSGTSLSGGALPLADGVLLGLGKLSRILEIDFDNRCAAMRSRTAASTTRPIPRARSPARSAATSRKIPAACIA
jgi:glycolate oxidase